CRTQSVKLRQQYRAVLGWIVDGGPQNQCTHRIQLVRLRLNAKTRGFERYTTSARSRVQYNATCRTQQAIDPLTVISVRNVSKRTRIAIGIKSEVRASAL